MFRTLLVIGVIAMITSNNSFAEKEFTYHNDSSFDAGAVKSIKIEMRIGDISIAKSHSGKVEVNFKNDVYASDQEEADRYNKEVRYNAELKGDNLIISIELPRHSRHRKGIVTRFLQGEWDEDYSPMLKVSVPDSKDIQIESASANIDASDVACNLDIKSASSDLVLENTSGMVHSDVTSGDVDIMGHRGSITIKANSSDIKIAEVEGDVDTYTSSGDGDFNKVKGALKSVSNSGDFRIYDIDGDLDARTSSGDIEVNSVTGSVSAGTVSGDIKLNSLAANEGVFDIKSVSGDIQVEISPDFKGNVQASTVSGSIENSMAMESETSTESQLRGRIGQGNGKLSVSTTSGDINIDKF